MVKLYLFIIYFHFHSFCHKLQHTEKVHNESSKERKKERKKERSYRYLDTHEPLISYIKCLPIN